MAATDKRIPRIGFSIAPRYDLARLSYSQTKGCSLLPRAISAAEDLFGISRAFQCDLLIAGSNPIINLAMISRASAFPAKIMLWAPLVHDTWNYNILLSPSARLGISEMFAVNVDRNRSVNEWWESLCEKTLQKSMRNFRSYGGSIVVLNNCSSLNYKCIIRKEHLLYANESCVDAGDVSQVQSDLLSRLHIARIFKTKFIAGNKNSLTRSYVIAKSLAITSQIPGFISASKKDNGEVGYEISNNVPLLTFGTARSQYHNASDAIVKPFEDIKNALLYDFERNPSAD